MLSVAAQDFIDELRSRWQTGSGPDANQLIALWKPRPPAELRPVLDELEVRGHVSFNRGMSGPDAQRSRYSLNSIVGITLL